MRSSRRGAEEGFGVLEVVAADHAAERLARLERLAVAGVDVADLALRNRHQRHAVHLVLNRPFEEMHAAAQQAGFEARLTAVGDDAALVDRSLARPDLFHDPDAIVGDDAHAKTHQQQLESNQHAAQCDEPGNPRADGQK